MLFSRVVFCRPSRIFSTMGLYSGIIMLQLFWLALVLLHGSFTPVSTVVVKTEVVSGSSEDVEIVLKPFRYYAHRTIYCSAVSEECVREVFYIFVSRYVI